MFDRTKSKCFVYAVYDKYFGSFSSMFVAENDALACRLAFTSLRVPLKDSDLYCLGDFVRTIPFGEHGKIDPIPFSLDLNWYSSPRFVSWDNYRLPETIADAVAPLGLSPDEVAELTRKQIEESK